jgi:formate dehydrogenase iron-sulfur subunit
MTIAAIAVGATQGYIFPRCEYPRHRAPDAAIAAVRSGYLGQHSRHREDT